MMEGLCTGGSARRGMSTLEEEANVLEEELRWLRRILDERLRLHLAGAAAPLAPALLGPPDLGASAAPYAQFVRSESLSVIERLAIVLALAPYLRPQLFDVFLIRNAAIERRFTEFGGVPAGSRGDGEFLPTGETLAFLLGGEDLKVRLQVARQLDPRERLMRRYLAPGGAPIEDLPPLKSPLRLSEDLRSLFVLGEPHRPTLSASFPAQLIRTELSWSDVVLPSATRKQLDELLTFIQHGDTLMRDWDMAGRLRPGHRSLFHGPPGTGKSMTACLLGKTTGRDVYKVDLSLVVSKYIGETEKNLGRVFDQAEHKGWILFFDEADALFGRRSETRDAHDRYANQEVAFLLQRIEVFDGITILATNLRSNIDTAFARRFESIVYFPLPQHEERLRLWRQGFPKQARLDSGVDLEKLAREHTLSGGALMNVIRYASLESLRAGGRPINTEDLLQGIQREYAKERQG